ncbi:hypothetical protein [Catellatospora methionotrophica]|uniref:hypothetical protein n=1 Tax=Catellatospora methionotrophica TaxID=121620 RepID=UPI0033C5966A
MPTLNTDEARGHLLAIFGSDLTHLPAHLRTAARHHRGDAEHLRSRQPDALIPAEGARMLAEGHDLDAERCDRAADQIDHILHSDGSEPLRLLARHRRPHAIVLTTDAHLHHAVTTAALDTNVNIAHYEAPDKARQNAARADLFIIDTAMAHWFTAAPPGRCRSVLAGVDPVDRAAAADHAHRLGVDLLVLPTHGHDALTALLAALPGARAGRS